MNYSNNKKKKLFFLHILIVFLWRHRKRQNYLQFLKKKESKYREIHTNTLNKKKRNVYNNNYESIIVFNNKIEELYSAATFFSS